MSGFNFLYTMIMSEMPHFEIKEEKTGESPCQACLENAQRTALNELHNNVNAPEALSDALGGLFVHTCPEGKEASCVVDAASESVVPSGAYEDPQRQGSVIKHIVEQAGALREKRDPKSPIKIL